MTKDYVKRGSHRPAQKNKRVKNKKHNLSRKPSKKAASKYVVLRRLCLFVLFLVAIVLLWVFLLHRSQPLFGPAVVEVANPVHLNKKQPAATSSPARFVFKPVNVEKPAPTQSFLLQLGTFDHHDLALAKLEKQLTGLGLTPHLSDVYFHGKSSVRLQVGPYKTQKEAAKISAKLQQAKIPSVFIG